jgi:hypothetical protein
MHLQAGETDNRQNSQLGHWLRRGNLTQSSLAGWFPKEQPHMNDTIKIRKESYEELKRSDVSKHISIGFRSYEDDMKFGYATVTITTPIGSVKLRLTVWKNKQDASKPRLGWYQTFDGYTTSVVKPKEGADPAKNKFRLPTESAVDSSIHDIIDAMIIDAIAGTKKKKAPPKKTPKSEEQSGKPAPAKSETEQLETDARTA